jgi:hypothetical protein
MWLFVEAVPATKCSPSEGFVRRMRGLFLRNFELASAVVGAVSAMTMNQHGRLCSIVSANQLAIVRTRPVLNNHQMLSATTARMAVRRLSSAAPAAAAKKVLKEPKAPVDKAKLSPVRGLFFGDLSQAQTRCVPFPQALDAGQKEVRSCLRAPTSSSRLRSESYNSSAQEQNWRLLCTVVDAL